MGHALSLEHLTVATVGPLELLDIAAACGCEAVNLRMEPAPYLPVPYYDVIGSPSMRANLRAKSRDVGVQVRTVDPFVLREDTTMAEPAALRRQPQRTSARWRSTRSATTPTSVG